jgi:hypothetical protein
VLPLLIHLHIPKNAGTTLSRMIKIRLATWPPTRLLHNATTLGYYNVEGFQNRLDIIEKLSPAQRRRVRFFEAHCGWGVHERLPEPSAYFTMLREPIDRALSVYWHLKSRQRVPEDMSIEQFLLEGDPRRVWWIDNGQVRYLAGEGGTIVDVPHGTCDDAMLEKAIRRLDDLWFVGIVDRFDASMLLLRRKLGWRRCYYGTSNVARKRQNARELSDEAIELLREHNRLDLKLYEHAVARLEREIAEVGDFETQLERYRYANGRYNRTIGRAYGLLPVVRRLVVRRSPSARSTTGS